MFEELPFMLGFWIFSLILSFLLFEYTAGILNKIVQGFAIIGIIIHEISHILICLITHTHIDGIRLIYKSKRMGRSRFQGNYEYAGRVDIHPEKHISFLQALAVAFAPLYISFWFFFFLLDYLLYTNEVVWIFFLSSSSHP